MDSTRLYQSYDSPHLTTAVLGLELALQNYFPISTQKGNSEASVGALST